MGVYTLSVDSWSSYTSHHSSVAEPGIESAVCLWAGAMD